MESTADPDPWSAPIGTLLIGVEELGRLFRDRFVAHEIEGGSAFVLRTLRRHGPMRMTDLAGHARLDLSTVSRHVRNLEARGYVSRRTDPADKRAHRLALTDDGTALIDSVLAESIAALRTVMLHWTPQELGAFSEYLARLVSDLRRSGPAETASLPTTTDDDATI